MQAVTPPLTALTENDGLRRALNVLADVPQAHRQRHALWQQLALLLLERATNCAALIDRHREDYAQEFIAAALECLDRRLDLLRRARSPWGLLVKIGDRAGRGAVATYATGGLTRLPAGAAGRPVVFSFDPERDDRASCDEEAW